MTDPAALFDELFESHFSYVWSVLRRLGVPERDTEDLVHEVFLHVHKKLDTYDARRPIRPWLFAFAYRVAGRRLRTARRRPEVLGVDDTAHDLEPRADEQLEDHERRSMLMKALDTLDLERRAVIVMHEWDEEPIPAVAASLDIPLNTAYSRLRTARIELAAAVKRLAAKEGIR